MSNWYQDKMDREELPDDQTLTEHDVNTANKVGVLEGAFSGTDGRVATEQLIVGNNRATIKAEETRLKGEYVGAKTQAKAEEIALSEESPDAKAATLTKMSEERPEIPSTNEIVLHTLNPTMTEDIRKKRLDSLHTESQVTLMLQEEVATRYKDRSIGSWILDIGEFFVPAAEATMLLAASKRSDVETSTAEDVAYMLLIGNRMTSMVEQLNGARGEDRMRLAQAAINGTRGLGVAGSDNALVALDILQRMADGDDTVSLVEGGFYNLFGVVDALPIIGAIKRGVKGISQVVSLRRTISASKIRATGEADAVENLGPPDVFLERHLAASESPEAAAALNITPEQTVTKTVAVTMIDDAMEKVGHRPQLEAGLAQLQRQNEQLAEGGANPVPYLESSERIKAQEDIVSELEGVSTASESLHLHSTQLGSKNADDAIQNAKDGSDIEGTSQDILVRATYGKEDGGFDTFIEAQGAIKTLGDFGRNARVIVFDKGDNMLKEVGGAVEDGQFYIRYEETRNYNPKGNAEVEILGDSPFFRESGWAGKGKVTSWTLDNGNRFKGWINNASNIAEDTAGFIEHQYKALIKPFVKLNSGDQTEVVKWLDEGARHSNDDGSIGKTFDYDEIKFRYPDATDEQIIAYYSARSAADHVYHHTNNTYRARLVAEEQKWVTHGKHSHTARPLQHIPSEKDVLGGVLDMETGEVRKLSKTEMEEMYAAGSKIGRLKDAYRTGSRLVDHVILDATKTKVKELPKNVINYRGGHFPRTYKENYFVRLRMTTERGGDTIKHGDANAYTRAIAAFGRKDEADAFVLPDDIQRLVDDGKASIEITFDLKKGLHGNEDELSIMKSQGRYFTAHQGEHLRGGDNTDLAHVDDPITSIQNAYQRSAHLMTHDQHIMAMETRFHKHFAADLDPNGALKADASAEAKEVFDYINLLKHTADPNERFTRAKITQVAEWLDTKGAHGTSAWVLGTRNTSVAQALRSTTFAVFIAANMAKQLVLQGLQFTMLAGMNPRIAIQSAVQAQGLLISMATDSERVLAAAAKTAGMSTQEFKALREAYMASGIPMSLSKHAAIQHAAYDWRHAMAESAWGKAKRLSGNMIKAPFKAMQTVGFNAGELENLTISWMMVHNNWKKTNKGKNWVGNKDVYASWGAQARAWTLNATKVGSYKFQRGMFSTATQFWAFQLKALSALTISEEFTKVQKLKMAAGLFTMWGTAGFGMIGHDSWKAIEEDYGEEIPKNIRTVVEHGFLDAGFNVLLDEFGSDKKGRESEVSFASHLSPISGTDLPIQALLSLDTKGVLESMSGVSYHMISRVSQTAKLMYDMWDEPPIDTAEDGMRIVHEAASFLPFYDQAVRGMWAKNFGYSMSRKTYQHVAAVTPGEAMVEMMLGFPSRKTEEVWEGRVSASEMRQTYKDVGRQFARQLNREFAIAGEAITVDQATRIMNTQRSIFSGMPPEGKALAIHEAMKSWNLSAAASETTWIKTYLNRFLGLDNLQSARAHVRNSVLLTPEEVDIANRFLDVQEQTRKLDAPFTGPSKETD